MDSLNILAFMNNTRLPFKAYEEFKRVAINERTDLYRAILEYEFGEYKGEASCKRRCFIDSQTLMKYYIWQ